MGTFGLGGIFGGLGGTPPIVPSSNPTTGSGLGSIFTNPQNLILLGSSILGSILNRPKGLSKEQQRTQDAQQRALQQLIGMLSQRANAPISIDPRTRAGLYGQAAESAVGATNRGLNALAKRGLSSSGITADFLGNVNQEQQRAQTGIDLALTQSAEQRKQQDQMALLSALGIPAQVTQSQSAGGAALEGFVPMLAYLMRLQQLQRGAGAP